MYTVHMPGPCWLLVQFVRIRTSTNVGNNDRNQKSLSSYFIFVSCLTEWTSCPTKYCMRIIQQPNRRALSAKHAWIIWLSGDSTEYFPYTTQFFFYWLLLGNGIQILCIQLIRSVRAIDMHLRLLSAGPVNEVRSSTRVWIDWLIPLYGYL